jgi:hypothetical protein
VKQCITNTLPLKLSTIHILQLHDDWSVVRQLQVVSWLRFRFTSTLLVDPYAPAGWVPRARRIWFVRWSGIQACIHHHAGEDETILGTHCSGYTTSHVYSAQAFVPTGLGLV